MIGAIFRFVCPPQEGFAVANMNLTALRAASSADSTIFIPRLIESAMQEVYRESSYYEGGACGYELHASGVRIVSNIKHLPHSVARRGLTLSRSLRIELSRDMLN